MTGDVAQWLRVLAAIPENPSPVPSTHVPEVLSRLILLLELEIKWLDSTGVLTP